MRRNPAAGREYPYSPPGKRHPWVFDYQVTLYFGDPNNLADPNHAYDISFTSNINGVTGIILTQDNRNHVGIGQENQNGIPRTATKPVVDSILTKVVLSIVPQDVLLPSTALNVNIVNRLNAASSQAMATAANVFAGQAVAPDSPARNFTVEIPSANMPLASAAINLADIVLPVVNITIVPGAPVPRHQSGLVEVRLPRQLLLQLRRLPFRIAVRFNYHRYCSQRDREHLYGHLSGQFFPHSGPRWPNPHSRCADRPFHQSEAAIDRPAQREDCGFHQQQAGGRSAVSHSRIVANTTTKRGPL